MDADWRIMVFVLIDTLMERVGHQRDRRAQVPDSEVILIASAAACSFQLITSGRCLSSANVALCRAGLMARDFIADCIHSATGWSVSRARSASSSASVRSL